MVKVGKVDILVDQKMHYCTIRLKGDKWYVRGQDRRTCAQRVMASEESATNAV